MLALQKRYKWSKQLLESFSGEISAVAHTSSMGICSSIGSSPTLCTGMIYQNTYNSPVPFDVILECDRGTDFDNVIL